MKLEEKIIKEIAGELDCGMVCFLNTETGEPKFVVDEDDPYARDVIELYREELDLIEQNRKQYIKIDKMPSHTAFQVMADFAETVENEAIREKLSYALSRNKPFRNFKYEVDYNEDVRQAWFKFKNQRYIDWVKKELECIG